MSKFKTFLLFVFFGFLFWQQASLAWRYFMFNPADCCNVAFLYYLWPLPGHMNNWSWIAIIFWLFVGIFLAASFPIKWRNLMLFFAVTGGLGFGVMLVMADTKCKNNNLCGSDFIASIQTILRRSYINLDITTCAELDRLNASCPDTPGSVTRGSCESVVKNLITYKDAGIDIKTCASKGDDCHNEYLRYFYDNLTNDLSLADGVCDQKYGNETSAGKLCHRYVNEWRQASQKPNAEIKQ